MRIKSKIVAYILSGGQRETAAGVEFMLSFKAALTDDQIASLASFLTRVAGSGAPAVKPEQVAALRGAR